MNEKAGRAFWLYLSKRHFKPLMIEWAVEVLTGGGSGNATTLLAGADYEEECSVLFLFRQAALEQHVSLPEGGEELEWLELWTCKEIVSGRISPEQGVSDLYQIWVDSSFDERFARWLSLSESIVLLEEGYGGLEPFDTLTLDAVGDTIMEEAKCLVSERARSRALATPATPLPTRDPQVS